MNIKLFLAASSLLALSACASLPPEPLRATVTVITPADAQTRNYTGQAVAWGGEVVRVMPMPQQTCFEMVAHRLDSQLRPLIMNDESLGRFVACRAGFFDPAVFTAGREVTFTGHVNGYMDAKVGEYSYHYPQLAADVIYLWGKRINREPYPYGPFGPYGYFGSAGWGWGMGW